MNEYGWVSLIALTGWLVLMIGAYRSYRADAKKTWLMVVAWMGLFLLVTGVFVAVGG